MTCVDARKCVFSYSGAFSLVRGDAGLTEMPPSPSADYSAGSIPAPSGTKPGTKRTNFARAGEYKLVRFVPGFVPPVENILLRGERRVKAATHQLSELTSGITLDP